MLARLVVPAGALAEPSLLRHFTHPFPGIPWPERYSGICSGAIRLALGAAGAVLALRPGLRRGARPPRVLPPG